MNITARFRGDPSDSLGESSCFGEKLLTARLFVAPAASISSKALKRRANTDTLYLARTLDTITVHADAFI